MNLCSVPSCFRRMKARGLCDSHYVAATQRQATPDGRLALPYLRESQNVEHWRCTCDVPLPPLPGCLLEECGRCRRPNYSTETIEQATRRTTS